MSLTTTYLNRQHLQSPMSLDISELSQQIQLQIQSVEQDSDSLPSLLGTLFVPGMRDRRRAMEELMRKKTDASLQMVNGLMGMIGVYISAHESDLRVRKASFMEATFQTLAHQLRTAAEGRYRMVMETLTSSLAAYESMSALPKKIREFAVEQAQLRAIQAVNDGTRSMTDGLLEMERQVRRLNEN